MFRTPSSSIAQAFLSVFFLALAIVFPSMVETNSDIDSSRQTGRQLGKQVQGLYGNPQAMDQRVYKPLSASAISMQTVDGLKTFETQVSCNGHERFMKVTILKNSHSDVRRITVRQDRDFDGTYEVVNTFNGPYAAVCTNGLLLCDPGATTNCRGRKWVMNGSQLTLGPVAADLVGGCYCFNTSCGQNLLTTNREKVLKDIGLGIANVLDDVFPRLSIGDHRVLSGGLGMTFSGQRCGRDTLRAEQHYANPLNPPSGRSGGLDSSGINRAVATVGSDRTSLYYKVKTLNLSSQYSDRSCRRTRNIVLDGGTVDSIVTVTSTDSISNDFQVRNCGPYCREYRIGKDGDDYLDAGSLCREFHDRAIFTVSRPDLIRSATYIGSSFDDYISVSLNKRLVWASPSNWHINPNLQWFSMRNYPRCRENTRSRRNNRPRGEYILNSDVTSHFTGVTPGSTVKLDQVLYVAEEGDGWSKLRLNLTQPCDLVRDAIDNGCSSAESDASCVLKQETVDGVVIREDYRSTGLSSNPSTRAISSPDGSCSKRFTKDWWEKESIYSCTSSRKLDRAAAADRYNTIHTSFDSDTGDFSDRRKTKTASSAPATYVTHSESTDLPDDDPHACLKVCKTKTPRPGVPMGDGGKKSDSPAWDYSYYECTHNGTSDVCPAPSGETVLETCGCGGRFAEAFISMQTIAQVKQDFICSGDLQNDGTCTGDFKIFSGARKRCRKASLLTAGQNCCKNTLAVLSDRMGAPGEIGQREYKKQGSIITFWLPQCSMKDQETSLLADSGYCVYVGTFCSKKVPVAGCVQRKKSYCCYNSQLAALVHSQVKTVPTDFGSVKRPDCSGFTPEEFQALDFSKIDLSSYANSVRTKSESQIRTGMRADLRADMQSRNIVVP